jgi:two-component system, cell cycle response regulator DivK
MPDRILIVDDHPINLKLASDVLALSGYEVVKAADAEQAQEILHQTVPDVILMDIALPGMDGLELTRRLRADARFDGVLVIALTASAMKGDDHKAIDAGCDGYITKPIDTRRLPDQVGEVLARHRAKKAK